MKWCTRHAVALGCLLFGLSAGAILTLTARWTPAGPPPAAEPGAGVSTALPPEEILAAIPEGKSKAAVDRAIQKTVARLRLDDGHAAGWAELGDALMQKARETSDAAYYGHAERAYNRALGLNPKNVEALAGLAWVASCRHEFDQSVDWAAKALALDPDHFAAHGLLGDAAAEKGDFDTAAVHYQKMLDLRPGLSSYSRSAHLLYLTGDFRKATWFMARAITAGAPYAENTAWCRAQLASMYFETGNLLAAEQVLDEVVGKVPDNYHLLAAQGKVKAARKDHAAAVACFEKAAAIAPQHEALAALYDLYRLAGRADDAEKQFAMIEATHRLNQAHGVRGDAQLALFYADHDRRLPEALAMAEAEYQRFPSPAAADALAWCCFMNGRLDEARKAVQKALAKRPRDATVLFHAGMIHARRGDRAQAQKHLYQALSLNPHFGLRHAQTAADVLQQLGSKPTDAPLQGPPPGEKP